MRENSKSKGQIMNVLFTMLLFLVFVLSALFTVLIGGRVYENINRRMDENYSKTTALSYIANKVRQGDQDGLVQVKELEGIPVLELGQTIGEETFVTWIYYKDGAVRELFTDENSGLGLDSGLEILACDGLLLSQDENLITIETTGQGGAGLTLALRSGGTDND